MLSEITVNWIKTFKTDTTPEMHTYTVANGTESCTLTTNRKINDGAYLVRDFHHWLADSAMFTAVRENLPVNDKGMRIHGTSHAIQRRFGYFYCFDSLVEGLYIINGHLLFDCGNNIYPINIHDAYTLFDDFYVADGFIMRLGDDLREWFVTGDLETDDFKIALHQRKYEYLPVDMLYMTKYKNVDELYANSNQNTTN